MLHPSYTDLLNALNEGNEGDSATINSRYSVVIAASKRARQLIDEQNESEEEITDACFKPLSIAVDEMNTGAVKIISDEETLEDEETVSEEAESVEEVEE